METIHCTNCGENVRPIRKQVAEKQHSIKQACDCTETGRNVLAYEVDGWEWISFDG